MQIDRMHRLNSHGWVCVVLTMCCMRYDETRGKHVRTPLPSLLMVTCAECKVGVVCFCTALKNLLIKCFHANIEIIAIAVGQDMPMLTRDRVKEAWPDSVGLPCSMRIGRKFETKITLKACNIAQIFC